MVVVDAEGSACKKRIAVWLILGLIGLVSFFVGSSWNAVLPTFATDLARTENTLNLINPNYIPLAHLIVAGCIGLGHFLFVFGVVATLIGLAGSIYTYLCSRGNPRWRTAGFHQAFLASAAVLVVLAFSGAMWVTSSVSYEDNLASAPPPPSTSSAGHKEHHAKCTQSPTPDQQEAADKLAADTKAGVTKYEDPSAAEADGYRPISPSWQPIGHYLDPSYQRKGTVLDPSRPEALVYANTSKGPVLMGAMYLMPESGISGPQIGGCLTQWHAHSLDGWETPEMMHVWTVNGYPGGPFSDAVRPREVVPS
jgi:hypothetical protein